jgi:hypothetical protein
LIYARNNIWSSTSYALRNIDIEEPVDLDYNTLWNENNQALVRWGDDTYATLAAFTKATGQEPNGFNLNPGFASPQTADYTLHSLSSLIDAGVLIPGINDDYIGVAPDIGAFESTSAAYSQVHLPLVLTR